MDEREERTVRNRSGIIRKRFITPIIGFFSQDFTQNYNTVIHLSLMQKICYNPLSVTRFGITLFFLIVLLTPSLFSLEEQSFQAKILIEERKEPSLIFPLSRPDFKDVENQFLLKSTRAEYILYETSLPSEADARDLCGFQEPKTQIPKGDIL